MGGDIFYELLVLGDSRIIIIIIIIIIVIYHLLFIIDLFQVGNIQ